MDKQVDFDYFAENYNNTIIKASKFILNHLTILHTIKLKD